VRKPDKFRPRAPHLGKPINEALGKNLELRNALRKKFGDVAHDPVQAEARHLSELKKGQKYLEYEENRERGVILAF
jgi:hypothetical protein